MARFSLKWLFVATALIAVYFYAIFHPSPFQAWLTAFVLAACLAVSLIVALRFRWRAPFAIGFVATALCYWLVTNRGESDWILGSFAGYPVAPTGSGGMTTIYDPFKEAVVSRSLLLTAAFCGGLFAQWLASKDGRSESQDEPAK